MSGDYVPHAELSFLNWADNFVSYLSEHAAELKVDAGELANLVAEHATFAAAYDKHVAARTAAEGACRMKDNARKPFTQSLRGIAQQIQSTRSIDVWHKSQLGLPTSPGEPPTPLEMSGDKPTVSIGISTYLTHILRIGNLRSSVFHKARPACALGCELWRSIGEPPTDRTKMEYVGLVTGNNFKIEYPSEHAGQTVYYMMRWIGKNGDKGAWSKVHSATVAA